MRYRLVLGALVGGLLGACNTPSVPLPPPDLPQLHFTAAPAPPGAIELVGMPSPRHANVRFTAFNETMGIGSIVETAADGSFTTGPFGATVGDAIEIYYESGSRRSDASICSLVLDKALDTTICH